jgi:ankyrin repeat protein
MATLRADDPIAIAVTIAIRTGDVATVDELLAQQPDLASARIERRKGTVTPLLITADWPGYFLNAATIARRLIAGGADPDAGTEENAVSETPLHWAASSDDVDVADALIDGGADIEAQGASIAGGSPIQNAVGYGCWHVARRLLQAGATVNTLWEAAALGLQTRVEQLVAAASGEEINDAFWQACSGGQRRIGEFLIARGADVTWIPSYANVSCLDAITAPSTRRDLFASWLREQTSHPADGATP